jgi:hypothetical protein
LQGAERAQFLESVARGWAKADGAAALAWVLEEPDPILRERLRRETLLSWGQSDLPRRRDKSQESLTLLGARKHSRRLLESGPSMTRVRHWRGQMGCPTRSNAIRQLLRFKTALRSALVSS